MVELKKRDLLKMEFTGSLASNDRVFETTDEQVAKSSGIFDEKNQYKAKLFFFGKSEILPGIEKSLSTMELNKETDLVIKEDDAFGKRNNELVRIVPKKEFEKRGYLPQVGMQIDINNSIGTVRAVSGGRVVVDFNHPLAGQEVKYKVKVVEVVKGTKEKVQTLIEELKLEGSAAVGENVLKLTLKNCQNNEDFAYKKSMLLGIVQKNIDEIASVESNETYSIDRKKEEKPEEKKE